MSEYQDEVLTNLLDLQAELRGDEPEPHEEAEPQAPVEALALTETARQETVAVTEETLTVSVPSVPADGMSVNERLAALNGRLAQLEHDLARVSNRMERIEPDPPMDVPVSAGADVDARWRSFLDLQKIVADRLDQR
jgi:hypothetical protein